MPLLRKTLFFLFACPLFPGLRQIKTPPPVHTDRGENFRGTTLIYLLFLRLFTALRLTRAYVVRYFLHRHSSRMRWRPSRQKLAPAASSLRRSR